jgi:hypothetical protein
VRSNHTRRHVHIPISSHARAILLIGLATLTLFVVGPLAGSIDDDGDGSPDIPVVVSDPVVFTDLSAARGLDQRSGNIHDLAPSRHLRSATPRRPSIDPPFLAADAGSAFDWCCSLRC